MSTPEYEMDFSEDLSTRVETLSPRVEEDLRSLEAAGEREGAVLMVHIATALARLRDGLKK